MIRLRARGYRAHLLSAWWRSMILTRAHHLMVRLKTELRYGTIRRVVVKPCHPSGGLVRRSVTACLHAKAWYTKIGAVSPFFLWGWVIVSGACNWLTAATLWAPFGLSATLQSSDERWTLSTAVTLIIYTIVKTPLGESPKASHDQLSRYDGMTEGFPVLEYLRACHHI